MNKNDQERSESKVVTDAVKQTVFGNPENVAIITMSAIAVTGVLALALGGTLGYGAGFTVAKRITRRHYAQGWKIVGIAKGTLRDTKNSGMEIHFKNGTTQIWELAPGESIP